MKDPITISLSVNDILLGVLLIAAIVTLVFLIRLLIKLTKSAEGLSETIANTNQLLAELEPVVADVHEISQSAKEATMDVGLTIKKATTTANSITDSIGDILSKVLTVIGFIRTGKRISSLINKKKK